MAATVCDTIRSTPSWPNAALDAARVAVRAVCRRCDRPQAIGAHQAGIDRQHQRGVGHAGMAADLRVAEALRAQRLHIGASGVAR